MFRPVKFVPTFDKWQGKSCGGVYIHITDKHQLNAYRTTVEILSVVRRLYGNEFVWLAPPYEYEYEKMPIDILSGSVRLREVIDRGDKDELRAAWKLDEAKWQAEIAPFQLY